jgi:hypothetical protein
MPVTGRHEQTPRRGRPLPSGAETPTLTAGVNIAFLLSRQGGRVAGGVTSEEMLRCLVTQYGTSSKERNSHD